jgi:hypothetical protein
MQIGTIRTIRIVVMLLWTVAISSITGAASVVSSTRTISASSTSSTRTTPGAFVDSISIGTTNSTTASQDSTLTETASLLKITGGGSTESARTISDGTSAQHQAESLLETNISPLNDSPYILSGRLTLENDVPLGGSAMFDNSVASIQLREIDGPSIFFADTNGSFNDTGVLIGGKAYQLRIESNLLLRTNQIFSKANGWTINLLVSTVPEPTCFALAALSSGCVPSRRRRTQCSANSRANSAGHGANTADGDFAVWQCRYACEVDR